MSPQRQLSINCLPPQFEHEGQAFLFTWFIVEHPRLYGSQCFLRPRLHESGQIFAHRQKLARFHPAFTRDRRNWTNFERPTAQVGLGPVNGASVRTTQKFMYKKPAKTLN